MKILLITAGFPPPFGGGSIEYLYNIYVNFKQDDVLIYTANSNPEQSKLFDSTFPHKIVRKRFFINVLDGYKANKFHRLKEYVFSLIYCTYLIVKFRPKIIHIGEHNINFLIVILAKKLFGIPYILYTYAEEIQQLDKRLIHKRLVRMNIKNANLVITVSEYTKNLLVHRGADEKKIYKLLPAISSEKIAINNIERYHVIKEKYSQYRVLLTVGRLIERKGHRFVINSLTSLIETIPNIKYIIIGDGPDKLQIENEVKRLKLDNYVEFKGKLSNEEVSIFYSICEVFIMPHIEIKHTLDTEGCPTVFLEAGAHGKPVIGGNAGGVKDAIINDKTGYIINGFDVNEIKEKVEYLLKNKNVAEKMGYEGVQYVKNLTPKVNAEFIEKINALLLNNTYSK